MCGIAGYSGRQPVAPEVLRAMAAAIRHRGPDEDGFYTDAYTGLAIRRLRVVDLETGSQPMHDERARYHIVYNGEIYNFQTLRAELLARGHRFVSQGDTEVIVHAFEEGGPDCFHRFNGMFAFAIWDTQDKILHLCRDRIGIKPLYWTVQDGTLVFASELKALLQFPGIPRRPDIVAIDQYLTYEYVPAPRSAFEGIHKLEPGHYLKWDGVQATLHSWWTLPGSRTVGDTDDVSDELLARLKAAVRMQLVADVPLGFFLSGGIDSSTLVGLASELAPGRVRTFSIGFVDRSFDESHHARVVAQHFATTHVEDVLTERDVPRLLEQLRDILDEPLADASIVPALHLSSLTRRHVTVALSGEGGDEFFAGYPTYQATRLASRLRHMPAGLRNAARELAMALPVSTANLSLDFRLKRFFSRLEWPREQRHILWMGSFQPSEKRALWRQEVNGDRLWEPLRGLTRGDLGDVAQALLLDQRLYLADDLLVKLDRASMAVSLEGRVPLLDHTLVEWVSSLPVELKMRGWTTKALLKKAVRGLLPERILQRPKKGFGIPVARWMAGPLRAYVQDQLSPQRVRQMGLFEAAEVSRLLREHLEGRADHRKLLWTLLMVSSWHQRWVET